MIHDNRKALQKLPCLSWHQLLWIRTRHQFPIVLHDISPTFEVAATDVLTEVQSTAHDCLAKTALEPLLRLMR